MSNELKTYKSYTKIYLKQKKQEKIPLVFRSAICKSSLKHKLNLEMNVSRPNQRLDVRFRSLYEHISLSTIFLEILASILSSMSNIITPFIGDFYLSDTYTSTSSGT